MSTKVYEAWRSKLGVNLFPTLVEDIRAATIPLVKKAIKAQYKNWEDMGDRFRTDGAHEDLHNIQGKPSKLDYSRNLKLFYKDQLGSIERSLFDLSLGFSVRYHKERYYILPFVGDFYRMHKVDVSKAVGKLDSLEDFAYWNNTDEPEGMDMDEWRERGKIWDELDEKWANYLYLDVVTFDTFYTLDPAWEVK